MEGSGASSASAGAMLPPALPTAVGARQQPQQEELQALREERARAEASVARENARLDGLRQDLAALRQRVMRCENDRRELTAKRDADGASDQARLLAQGDLDAVAKSIDKAEESIAAQERHLEAQEARTQAAEQALAAVTARVRAAEWAVELGGTVVPLAVALRQDLPGYTMYQTTLSTSFTAADENTCPMSVAHWAWNPREAIELPLDALVCMWTGAFRKRAHSMAGEDAVALKLGPVLDLLYDCNFRADAKDGGHLIAPGLSFNDIAFPASNCKPDIRATIEGKGKPRLTLTVGELKTPDLPLGDAPLHTVFEQAREYWARENSFPSHHQAFKNASKVVQQLSKYLKYGQLKRGFLINYDYVWFAERRVEDGKDVLCLSDAFPRSARDLPQTAQERGGCCYVEALAHFLRCVRMTLSRPTSRGESTHHTLASPSATALGVAVAAARTRMTTTTMTIMRTAQAAQRRKSPDLASGAREGAVVLALVLPRRSWASRASKATAGLLCTRRQQASFGA